MRDVVVVLLLRGLLRVLLLLLALELNEVQLHGLESLLFQAPEICQRLLLLKRLPQL